MILLGKDKVKSIWLFRTLFKERKIVSYIRLVFSICTGNFRVCSNFNVLAGYSRRRMAGDRFYVLIDDGNGLGFIKIDKASFEFCSDIIKLAKRDRFYGRDYIHRPLNRPEFEKFGFGLSSKVYHGDLIRENVLVNGKEIILIDFEFERVYSKTYQNLDYLLNRMNPTRRADFIWSKDNVFRLLQIYEDCCSHQYEKALIERKRNGCVWANKVI